MELHRDGRTFKARPKGHMFMAAVTLCSLLSALLAHATFVTAAVNLPAPSAPQHHQAQPLSAGNHSASTHNTGNQPFRSCDQVIKGANAGTVHSPFFPRPFPVPIHCKWTIEAPAGKVIAVYLSQFYLRDGFKATEYAFLDSSLNVGKRELGPFTFDESSAIILTTKPILVLELELYDASNIHVRVMDFFLDVYGFNITYKVHTVDLHKLFKQRWVLLCLLANHLAVGAEGDAPRRAFWVLSSCLFVHRHLLRQPRLRHALLPVLCRLLRSSMSVWARVRSFSRSKSVQKPWRVQIRTWRHARYLRLSGWIYWHLLH